MAGAFLLLFACGQSDQSEYSGYVEGEFIRPGPIEGGTLTVLHVREGDPVSAGDPLFALDDVRQKAGVAAAEASLSELRAQLQNLKYGRRPEEVAVLEARREQATANLKLARINYDRAVDLLAREVASPERRDQAEAEFEAAEAEVAALDAELAVARLPARQEEIDAAEAAVSAAEAAVDEARWHLKERRVVAGVDGRIEDRYFLPGDFVAAGAPVIAILPTGGVKIRFFVPQAEISGLRKGQEVGVACDGCPDGLSARVSFIARKAEFTPPVIYSEKTRAKLMFRVEARPAQAAEQLHPGLPIDVTVSR